MTVNEPKLDARYRSGGGIDWVYPFLSTARATHH